MNEHPEAEENVPGAMIVRLSDNSVLVSNVPFLPVVNFNSTVYGQY